MKNLIKNRTFHIVAFEALASFILTYGVSTSGKHFAPDVVISSALFLAIAQSGQITGGYVNPVVTIGMYVDNRHKKLGLYLLGQFLGALLGAFVSWGLLGQISAPCPESEPLIKFIFNQFFGSGIFVVCVLTLTNKFTSYAVKSWQIYLSVPVALFLVRKMTGSTCINPAVGLALQMVAAWGSGDVSLFLIYIWPLLVPSVFGAIIGGLFTTKFYEPLLLHIKYKDLSEEDFQGSQERSHDGQRLVERDVGQRRLENEVEKQGEMKEERMEKEQDK